MMPSKRYPCDPWPLPWQQNQWRHLYQAHQADRLPHAVLLTGQAGLGKSLFAAAFAQTLLCQQASASGAACHRCRDCLLVVANTHPDLFDVHPEKKNQGIKIEQIRHLIQRVHQTSQSSRKIFIIDPADSLLVASSNALLKSLEEPTAGTLFMLITDKLGLLLPTIRSRCQMIRFTVPHQSLASAWLGEQLSDLLASGQNPVLSAHPMTSVDALYELADAAPLQVVEYVRTGWFVSYPCLLEAMLQLVKKERDPLTVAERFLKTDGSMLLHSLMKIICTLLKYQFQMSNPDTADVLCRQLAPLVNPIFLFRYFDKLLELQRHAKIAMNQQLMLEDLFCYWFSQGEPC